MALHFLVDEQDARDDVARAGAADVIALTGAEAHHAAVVRRVRIGEEVTLGDGQGVWLTGEVVEAAAKLVRVRVAARVEVPPSRPRLVLVQALAKGDRDELAIQAATELGADEVVPWQAARSVSRWSAEKTAKGLARWRSIVREAAKQAHRAWVPEVVDPVTTRELANRTAGRMLVLEPTASVALTDTPLAAPDDGVEEIVLVVGPEGGIAPDELDTLRAAGATIVRLGDTVLRTSTAGPAALAVLNARLGRW